MLSRGRSSLVVVAVGLALVLTWLLTHSLKPTDREYAGVQEALVGISVGESQLSRDVLSARSGLLRDADQMGAQIVQLRRSLSDLYRAANGEARTEIDHLATALREQEIVVEELKLASGVVQKALTSFNSVIDRISEKASEPGSALRIAALTAAMLHLSRDASDSTVAVVNAQLAEIATYRFAAELAPDVATLAQNSELLASRLPEVDDLVERFSSLLTFQLRRDVRGVFILRRNSLEQRSTQFRVSLYLVAIFFLGSLVQLGWRLRVGALAMHERAEMEHLLAQVSNDFIGCQPEDIRAMMLQALARYGTTAQSDRTYLVFTGEQPDVLMWSRSRTSYPAGWPDAIGEVLPVLDADEGDVFSTSGYGKLPPPAVRELLVRFQRVHWSCAKIFLQGKMKGILVFERTLDRAAWLSDIEQLIRLAGITMSNALQKEVNAQQRSTLEEQVQRAKRLEVVGLFASGIAHNFNNLLSVMLGHAEAATELLPENSTPAQHIRHLTQVGERASSLVENIMAYGRRGAGLQRPINAGELIAETAALLRPSIPLHLDVQVDLPPGDVVVSGVPTQLQQVLVNLIRNAAQASDAGATVILAANVAVLSAQRVLSHGAIPAGTYIRVSVIDEGAGIPDKIRARLFEPFLTTRPAGTGLGLATAAEVVRDMGGAFHVISAVGNGTTFEVWLPVQVEDVTPVVPHGHGEVVLIAGGLHPTMLRIEDMLANLGYEPVGVNSAASALAALRAGPTRFDAVVIVGDLGDMSSVDLNRAVQTINRQVPVRILNLEQSSINQFLTDEAYPVTPNLDSIAVVLAQLFGRTPNTLVTQ